LKHQFYIKVSTTIKLFFVLKNKNPSKYWGLEKKTFSFDYGL